MGCNELLFAKGVFPYEYFDSLDRFQETHLPPQSAFYNNLNMQSLSDDDYLRAQNIWETFECVNFKNYHDFYLRTDTLLLADCFQHFREMCMTYYGLDPAHYLTFPSYCWDACLRYTGVSLELITDPEIHLFIENSIRGGISVISHRYAKANNPYLTPEEYDSTKPISYLIYLDANNLYGFPMSQKLPISGFKFLSDDEISQIDFSQVSDDSEIGYIIQCDLVYPECLHDAHKFFPLAVESVLVTRDMLSPFCQSFGNKHIECKKLIPNLNDKTKYTTHYRNLKLYLSLGLKLGKIHRVLAFK